MIPHHLHFGVPIESNHYSITIDASAFEDFCLDCAARDQKTPEQIGSEEKRWLLDLFLLLEELQHCRGDVLILNAVPSCLPLEASSYTRIDKLTVEDDPAQFEARIAEGLWDSIIAFDLLAKTAGDTTQRLMSAAIESLRSGGGLLLLPLPLRDSLTEVFHPERPPEERLERRYDTLALFESLLEGLEPFYDLDLLYYRNAPNLLPEASAHALRLVRRRSGVFRRLEDKFFGHSEVHYYHDETLPR